MKDGVYQVTTPHITAGFVVRKGKVVTVAPVLMSNFSYWKKIAVKIA